MNTYSTMALQNREQDKPAALFPVALEQWKPVAEILSLFGKLGLIIGVALTGLYYASNATMPSDSLSSLGALGVSIASISLCAFSFAAGAFIAPALASGCFSHADAKQLFAWIGLTLDLSRKDQKRGVRRSILFMTSVNVATWACLIYLLMPFLFTSDDGRRIFLSVCCALSGFGFLFLNFTESRTHPSAAPKVESGKNIRNKVLFTGLSMLLSAPAFIVACILFVNSEYGRDDRLGVEWALVSMTFLIVVGANTVSLYALATMTGPQRYLSMLLAGCMALTILALTLASSANLLNTVMVIAGVRINAATLVLDPEACDALTRSGTLNRQARTDDAAKQPCLLEHVTVLSRIGTTWMLSCPRYPGDSAPPSSPVRRADVPARYIRLSLPVPRPKQSESTRPRCDLKFTTDSTAQANSADSLSCPPFFVFQGSMCNIET